MGKTTAGEHDLHYWLYRETHRLVVKCTHCGSTVKADIHALRSAREGPAAALQTMLGTCEENVQINGFGPP